MGRSLRASGELHLGFAKLLADPIHIKGRQLVDVIVEPVRKQQAAVTLPINDGWQTRVVVGEIVFRYGGCLSRSQVAFILVFQTQGFIFRMAGNKQLPTIFTGNDISSCNF